jgi:death-on-curing protein
MEVAHRLASVFYPDYPDRMPALRYLGGEHGVRQLESALAVPQQTFGGRYLHRTIFDKTAALFRSLIIDHPLEDGNKRLAVSASFLFLYVNGYLFFRPPEETVAVALRVAVEGRSLRLTELVHWVRTGSMPMRLLEGAHGEASATCIHAYANRMGMPLAELRDLGRSFGLAIKAPTRRG